MESFVQFITTSLLNKISKEAIVFIISIMPLLELRGGLIAASILKVPYIRAAIFVMIGNILPIPFVLLLIEKILLIMEKWSLTKKFAIFLRHKAEKNKPKIDKYGFLGLALFVGIPLPGTGAWTGSLVAALFHMDYKKSLISIFLGIIMAFIIMSIISYGVIFNLIH